MSIYQDLLQTVNKAENEQQRQIEALNNAAYAIVEEVVSHLDAPPKMVQFDIRVPGEEFAPESTSEMARARRELALSVQFPRAMQTEPRVAHVIIFLTDLGGVIEARVGEMGPFLVEAGDPGMKHVARAVERHLREEVSLWL